MLAYAAAPVCLVFALLTAGSEDGSAPVCGAMGSGSLLGGMATMYMVMAIFHSGPWLSLLSNRLNMKDL